MNGPASTISERCTELVLYLNTLGYPAPPDFAVGFEQKATRLSVYVELLERWTARVDLVSPGPANVLIERHIVDCAAAWIVLRSKHLPGGVDGLVDIGSGAGLPGLIWAILSPNSKVTLVEPRQKRVMFLREIVGRLGLKNVLIADERMQELSLPLTAYSLVTSRAVGEHQVTLETLGKHTHPNGMAVFLVGPSYKCDVGTRFGEFIHYGLLCYKANSDGPERAISVWKRST